MKKSLMLVLIILTLGLFASLGAANLLSPTGDGGFETGSDFAANGWTVVNHTTNMWYVGALGAQAGTNGAYISNDAGVTTNYTNSSSQTSHFYRDIAVPAGSDNLVLSFKWKAGGESTWDRILVYVAPTTVTPVAGTPASNSTTLTGATLIGTLNLQSAAWQTASVSGGAAFNGTNVRLIFTWQNDGSGGVNPGALIDYITADTYPTMAGTYSINPSGGDYTTFTAAINAINSLGVGAGGVTFNVAAGTTYTENCPPVTVTGTAANPIVFQKSGAGANPIIYAGVGTGTTDAILKLSGVDYFTWNGIDLYENAANTTTTQQAEYGLWVTNSSATNGSQYNLFRDFKIVMNKTNTSSRGIYHHYGTTPTSLDGNNSNNDYYNITIENAYYGIYMYGSSSTTYLETNNYIRNCIIGGASAGDISGPYGIYATYEKDMIIRYNEVRNMGYTSTIYGMYLTSFRGTANQVYANKIHDIAYTGTSTSSNYGLYFSMVTSGTNEVKVYNNMIWGQSSGYTGAAATGYAIYGMYFTGAAATNTFNVDFNSVRIEGPATMSSAALYIYSAVPINKIRNNVLANFSGGNATPYHISLFAPGATAVGTNGSVCDHNVFYVANATGGYPVRGSTTNYASLAAWQAATSFDDYSRDTDPRFISSSDIHIQTDIPTPVESKGSYFSGTITWVTVDIDGNTRTAEAVGPPATAPDMGADEGPFTLETFCETPTVQPDSLAFNAPTSTALSGSFTAADQTPEVDNYLVVRHNIPLVGGPVDETTYVAGNTVGTNGTVVLKTSLLEFSATGLEPDSLYYFTIYSFNTNGIGGPKYLLTDPLTGSKKTLPTAPAVPAAFTATAASSSQISLASTANGNGDNILVAWNTVNTFGTPLSTADYVADDPITGGGTVYYVGSVAGLPNDTGLNGSTTYYYKAWSYVTSDVYEVYSESGLSANATTWATPVSLPYAENFDSTPSASLPTGWARFGTSTTTYATFQTGTTYPVSTPNSLIWYNSSDYTPYLTVVTPPINASLNTVRVRFYARNNSATTPPQLLIGTANNPTASATFTQFGAPIDLGIVHNYYEVNMSTYSGSDTFIAFRGVSTSGTYDYIYIDDVSVSLIPTVPQPPINPIPSLWAVNQDIITNLNWTNDGPLTKLDVYFGTDSTLVETLDSSVRVATDQTTPLNSFDLPVLDYATHYFWRVVCKDDLANTATGDLWSFDTMADPSVALPFAENFGSSTTLPAGWTKTSNMFISSTHGNPNYGLYCNLDVAAETTSATLPQLGPITGIAIAEFDYRFVDYTSYPATATVLQAGDSLNVMMSTDYGQTFSQLYSVNSTNHINSNAWKSMSVPLGTLADARIILRFDGTYGGSGDYYLDIDNFVVRTATNAPVYVLTPTSWDFGVVDQTANIDKQFEIKNEGAVDFTITDISLSGDTDFTLVNVPNPLPTLGLGETANFTVRFSPSSGGAHTATLSITDDVSRTVHTYTDSLTGIGVAPLTLPYTQNFDSNWDEIVFSSVDTHNWVVGALAKPSVLTAPHSGLNAMATVNLTGDYALDNLDMWATLPNVEISGTSGVIVDFWQAFESEASFDNLVLEYSKNLGATWARVDSLKGDASGNFVTPNSFNWYNQDTTSGDIDGPKFGGTSTSYTGHTNNWIHTTSMIPLSSLGEATTLKLRYYFNTDTSGNAYEGFAIDDISIIQQPLSEYALSNFSVVPVDYKFTGDSLTYAVTVTNNGYETTGINVNFKVGDTVVGTVASGAIATYGTTVVEFKYAIGTAGTYTLSAVLDADENAANNTVTLTNQIVFNTGWLAEGFENTFLPSRWIKWGNTDNQQWVQGATHYDGAFGAQTPVHADSASSFLGTPKIAIATGDSLFFWAKASVTGPQIQIRYNATADTSAVWTALGSPIALTTTDYVAYAVDLSSLNGSQYRFAFEAVPNGASGTVYLDRVLGPIVYIPTSAPGPVVMISPADRVIDVDPRTVTLDWDVPLSGGDAEGYAIFIGTVNDTTLVDTYTNYYEVFPPNTQYTPYTANPSYLMDYETDYYWMIVPYNGFGNPNLTDCPIWKLTTQVPPLSGNWTIDPNGSGLSNFTNFTDCINYLNSWGVAEGGVTVTVAQETYIESFPAITYNGTETTQAIFVADAGARTKPVLMPLAGTGTTDAIITFNGCDYVTFDGFDIKTNPANLDATTRAEFGISVKNNGATDGAKNNTVKNCDITLYPAWSSTRGVYQTVTSVTTPAGANSYNKYYDNVLTDCWYGYYLNGSTTTGAFDTGNEIGAVATGTITNCLQGVNYSNQIDLQIYNQTIVLLGGATPTAYLYGISGIAGASNTVTINGNEIYGASQVTASQYIYGISITAGSAASIHDNLIHNLSGTYTSGYIYGIYLTAGAAKQTNYVYDNDIYDITTNSNYVRPVYVTASALYEIYGNNVYNITNTYSTGSFYGYYIGANSTLCSGNFYNNTLHDINNIYSVYGMYIYYGLNVNIYNNQIYNVTATGTSTMYGLSAYYGTTASVKNTYNNVIHGLSNGGIIYGLYVYYGATQNVYKNKVYDITYTGTSTSVINGMYLIGNATTTTINAYNNFIYNLKAPAGTAAASAPQISGIYTSTAYLMNLWNNTVYLNAASTGSTFSTAALYLYSGATVDFRNNIFDNKSTPGASGRTVAFWKGGTAGSFTNVSATTDKNIYYAGNSGAINLIYYDGTNAKQSVDTYKALIATKDQNSVAEDVPFVTSSREIDVHINPAVETFVEGNAIVIATVTDDIDGDVRNATTPDIGADEGTFTGLVDVVTPSAQPTTLVLTPASTSINGVFTLSDAGYYLVVRHVISPLAATPIELKKYAIGDTLGANGTIIGKVSVGAFDATELVTDSLYYFTLFAYNANAVYGPKYLTTAPLSGSKRTLPPAPLAPAAFTATSAGASLINLLSTANANGNNILVARNTVNTFGTPASTADYNVGDALPTAGTVYYIGAAASLPNDTGLPASTTYYYKAWSYVVSDVFEVYSATGLSANATTWSAPVTVYPFNEGFETGFTDQGTIGAPYSQARVSGSYDWIANSSLTTYNRTPRTGLFNATIHYSCDTWLFRGFTLQAGTEYTYEMYARQDGSTSTASNITVAYGNAPTAAAMTNTIIATTGIINGDYQLLQGTFTPSATGDYMIGIKGYMNSAPWWISIDDISLRPTPTTPQKPINPVPVLAATNQSNGVNLGWKNDGPLTKIDVYFSTDSTLVATLDSSVRVATDQTDPLNSYNLPILDYSTRYFWRVICKDNFANVATGDLWYFNTMADPSLPLPYNQDFGTATSIPTGWTSDMAVATSHGQTGSGLYKNLWSSAVSSYANMPQIGPIPAATTLKFDYRFVDYTSYPLTPTILSEGDSLNIMVSNDFGTTFTQFATINSTNHTATMNWNTVYVPIIDNGFTVGDRIIIKFAGAWAAGDWYLDIDNVSVFAPPDSAIFAITPASYDFLNVEILSSSTPKEFVISDGGLVPFNVSSIYVEGGNAAEFSVVATGLTTEVDYDTPYSFTVTLSPTSLGAKSTTLKVVDDISRTIHEIPLTGNATPEDINPPVNLAATISDYTDVTLTWQVKDDPYSAPYLSWDNGTNSSNWGYSGDTADTLDVAIKFTTADLARFGGWNLNKIKFYASTYTGNTYRVRVWTGADDTITPTTMVVDQAVASYTVSSWNEIVLNTPYTITGSDAIWIGFHVETTIQAYPMPADNGIKVRNQGSLSSRNNGGWASSASTAGNWNIKGYIEESIARSANNQLLSIPVVINDNISMNIPETMDPRQSYVNHTRDLAGFNVYRDDVQINTSLVTETTYEDLGLANATYNYYVEAVYVTGNSVSAPLEVVIDKPAPYVLTFTEDWSSSSFDTQLWTKDSDNWSITTLSGHPQAAKFNYIPMAFNYSSSLSSWEINTVGINEVVVKYDVMLSSQSSATQERLAVELYYGSAWHEIDSFSNASGSFGWTSKTTTVLNLVGNSIVKLRFRAYGSDSSSLWYWGVDNVSVEALSAIPAPVVEAYLNGTNIDLSWEPILGVTSYKVYCSSAFEATFPDNWNLLQNNSTTSYSFATDNDTNMYFRVIAVIDGRFDRVIQPRFTPVRKTSVGNQRN